MSNNTGTWYEPAEGTTAHSVRTFVRVVFAIALLYMGLLSLLVIMGGVFGI